jgi:hypothetical protein
MYCPKFSPDFVNLASCTVPNSTCTVQKLSFYVRVVSSILILYCLNFILYVPIIQLFLFEKSSCNVQILHLILSNRYLVLSYIRLVLSKNHLVLSQFRVVHTKKFNFFDKKSSCTVQEFHLILIHWRLVLSQFQLVLSRN